MQAMDIKDRSTIAFTQTFLFKPLTGGEKWRSTPLALLAQVRWATASRKWRPLPASM
ncbi:hypothetical protein DESC_700236 [Desulfosarcina cetonica]|nr:hypothetical protein DESC_700236 [Desulfosarcina cetonica]